MIRRALGVGLVYILILVLAVGVRSYFAFHHRIPGYTLVLNVEDTASGTAPRSLPAGFARLKINPVLSDPQRPVYHLAGFSQNRKATAIHDDFWGIACVFDDDCALLVIVALDAIGFFS